MGQETLKIGKKPKKLHILHIFLPKIISPTRTCLKGHWGLREWHGVQHKKYWKEVLHASVTPYHARSPQYHADHVRALLGAKHVRVSRATHVPRTVHAYVFPHVYVFPTYSGPSLKKTRTQHGQMMWPALKSALITIFPANWETSYSYTILFRNMLWQIWWCLYMQLQQWKVTQSKMYVTLYDSTGHSNT
jgi:hypothetical protein